MIRRFVNLVTRNWPDNVYSVRRMDPYKQLFYPSATAALEAADGAAKNESFSELPTLELPRASMNLSAKECGGTLDMFALFRPRAAGEGRIVYANSVGASGLYDADRHVHSTMGVLNEPKGISPMCLSVALPGSEDGMYVLDTFPMKSGGRCFEVLECVPSSDHLSEASAVWRWRLLPPPPFVSPKPLHLPHYISACATVVDGNGCPSIYVSCDKAGTYRFETVRHDPGSRLGWSPSEEWSRVGDWKLPFHGRAEYVPEFNLWFGFFAFNPNDLCAADLSAMDPERRPQAALQVWQDLNAPDGDEWTPIYLNLLNLGDGKFLITKVFESELHSDQFALLTGIEMMAGVGDDRSIKMVKHKSSRFDFVMKNDSTECVL